MFRFSTERAPCYPSKRCSQCAHCSRLRVGEPPEDNRVDVIDGSVVVRGGVCAMFDLQPVLQIPAQRVAEAA